MDWADVILAGVQRLHHRGLDRRAAREKMINASARDLPGQQPRVRLPNRRFTTARTTTSRTGTTRPDRRLERRRRPRAGPDCDNRRGTGRRDQQSTQAQGRPGPDRMPDRARRLQFPAHRMGRKSRPRQHPPAPDHLIHEVMSPRFPGLSGAVHNWQLELYRSRQCAYTSDDRPPSAARSATARLPSLPAVSWTAQGWSGWRVCLSRGAGSAAGRTCTPRCRRYHRESRRRRGPGSGRRATRVCMNAQAG